jgi:NAD(P)-dependent dehydrogenase (short-subunit alcohol dehydrogenase family)
MTQQLAGQSALVTGGGGGFGRQCALLLAQDGAAVTLMGRSAGTLEAAREWLLAEVPGARVTTCPGDATCEADVAAAVDAADGPDGLRIVVGTVGGNIGWGTAGSFSYEDFLASLRLNAGSAYLAVRCAVPRMTSGGAFAFISSTAAVLSFRGLAGYCSGKAALDQFVRVAADDLAAQNIRLNCVRPGLTPTDGMRGKEASKAFVASFDGLIPLGRTGEAVDIARAVRYLVGPEASWVTGQSFAVDGGNELRGAPAPLPARVGR